jgi:alpha-tubulin suppressor-like RCC1 family protein
VRPAWKLAPLLLAGLTACGDRNTPLTPDTAAVPPQLQAQLRCRAELASRSLRCEADPSSGLSRAAGGPSRLIVGGQGVNVQLASSNVAYDRVSGVFSADLTVQNLLPEALGTADWFTLSGVRVFFHSGTNVTGGSGVATLRNPDGVGVFTGSSQPYFHYAEALPPNAISAPRRWEWQLDPGVTAFDFTLFVDAARAGDDPGQGRYASVSTGGAHACALTPGGKAYCWGASSYGQLGSGDFDYHDGPVAVARGGFWRSLVAGDYGTCGTRDNGETYCWGRFTVPQSLEDDSLPCAMAYHCRPDRVRGDPRLHLVSVGQHHTCGILETGEAWCWGLAGRGALGNPLAPDTCDVGGPVRCAVMPLAVEGGLRFNDLVGGVRHSCGLRRGGEAWCWGDNRSGQLGIGSRDSVLVPQPVLGGIHFSQLDTYEQTTCGLTPEGQAWCWGDNWHGQLGDGTVGTDVSSPVRVAQGELRFLRLAVGFEHVCGLVATGEAWCWGGNTFGQLGDGKGGDFNLSPTPVAVAGGLRFRDLDAGHLFTCGITRTGDAWCWGHGLGQPGTPGVSGTYQCHWEPCSLEPSRIKDPQD